MFNSSDFLLLLLQILFQTIKWDISILNELFVVFEFIEVSKKKNNQEIALVGLIAIQEGNNLADFTNPISANYF